MTTKLGLASVSYGIGVQNRYSAFLEDEDGIVLGKVSSMGRQQQQQASAIKSSKSANKLANGSASAQHANNNKQTNGAKIALKSAPAEQKNKRAHQQHDGKRQRANPGGNHHQAGQVANGIKSNGAVTKQGNSNQDTTANNNRTSRNHYHQLSASQGQPSNKENQHENGQGKFARNNFNGNSRRFQQPNKRYGEDNRKAESTQQQVNDDGSSFNQFGAQLNEEEKRRRQQKRVLDLKHKDYEKREARRNQQASATVEQSQESNANNNMENAQGGGDYPGPKGPKNNRRDGANREASGRPFGRGSARPRGRRSEQGGQEENNETERNDGQQQAGAGSRPQQRNGANRLQRNRNGFGTGSRGSRGSRGEGDQAGGRGFGRDSEKQKPIPNFSDKLDFPSLAS